MIVEGLPWAQGAESIETVVITTLSVSKSPAQGTGHLCIVGYSLSLTSVMG